MSTSPTDFIIHATISQSEMGLNPDKTQKQLSPGWRPSSLTQASRATKIHKRKGHNPVSIREPAHKHCVATLSETIPTLFLAINKTNRKQLPTMTALHVETKAATCRTSTRKWSQLNWPFFTHQIADRCSLRMSRRKKPRRAQVGTSLSWKAYTSSPLIRRLSKIQFKICLPPWIDPGRATINVEVTKANPGVISI